MKELDQNRVALFGDNSWLTLSFTKDWKNTYTFVEDYLNENLNKKLAEKIMNDIKAVIYVLVHDGSGYEDIVLKTALLYLFCKKTGTDVERLSENFSTYVITGAKLLLDKTNKKYLDNIFDNEEFSYLNKIKLSEYISVIKNLKEKKDTDALNKKVDTAKYVVNKYGKQVHKGLLQILKSLI